MTQSVVQPFQLTLISNDFETQETVKDVIFTLEHLSGIIDDVFGQINSRLAEEKSRVNKIKQRVSVCQEKVKKIKGSNQAITVFSTSKFPAPKTLPSFPTLFNDVNNVKCPFRDIEEEARVHLPDPQMSLINQADIQGDVYDILTRLNGNKQELERVEFIMEDNGLGPLPNTVSSIGSLLLFNSKINLYKNYQNLDNLISTGKEKSIQEEKNKTLESAPMTLISGDALPDIESLDLMYKPAMSEITNLALPENLPLDFIANIQYTAIDLPSIAPTSQSKTNQSSSTMSFSSLPSAKQPTQRGSILSPNTNTSTPVSSPPPPPPVTSNTAIPNAPISTGLSPPPPPPPKMSIAPPPPPPPSTNMPPPPPPTQNTEATLPDSSEDQDDSLPKANGGRANLLDAIKGMSVSKLRNKEESAMAAIKTQKKVEQNKPLTMQEALKERLSRRNNAISGKNDKEQKRRDSLVVQAARTSMSGPPKTLVSFGFAEIENSNANQNNNDDDSIPKFRSSTHNMNNYDSDSEISELSLESQAVSMSSAIPPPPKPPLSTISNPIPPPPPTAPINSGGLLNASNPALASMLKKARQRNGSDSDDSGGDEWD